MTNEHQMPVQLLESVLFLSPVHLDVELGDIQRQVYRSLGVTRPQGNALLNAVTTSPRWSTCVAGVR